MLEKPRSATSCHLSQSCWVCAHVRRNVACDLHEYRSVGLQKKRPVAVGKTGASCCPCPAVSFTPPRQSPCITYAPPHGREQLSPIRPLLVGSGNGYLHAKACHPCPVSFTHYSLATKPWRSRYWCHLGYSDDGDPNTSPISQMVLIPFREAVRDYRDLHVRCLQ